jgi:DNA (cytosine-5)-methyltransferase 1
MTYASVCSGIGSCALAWHPLGWETAFFAEIDPFCCALLKHYYPGVPNLGDMLTLDAAAWRGKVDLLAGGTPCQAFSVAGLRRSLADDRGNLTLRFVEIADAIEPRYVVWENVSGVLSTRDNAFGCFLGALVGADTALVPPNGCRWTDAGVVDGPQRLVAWRVLDAQYFGLAQRRERVFVVAGLRDGAHPAEVLFEREGVQRHFAPRREAGKGTAEVAGIGFTPSSHGTYREGSGTLRKAGGDIGGWQ